MSDRACCFVVSLVPGVMCGGIAALGRAPLFVVLIIGLSVFVVCFVVFAMLTVGKRSDIHPQ